MKKIIIVIPARYASKRFPGKPLAKILGIPMIVRVATIAKKVKGINAIIIATDDKKIVKVCKKYNLEYLMTSKNCLTGTDRLSEVAKKIKADVYVNLQGDEPLVLQNDIKKVIKEKILHNDQVICGYTKLKKDEHESDNSIPKVVFNKEKYLIYISRSAVPGSKKKHSHYYKQVCIYAFNRKELMQFSKQKKKGIIEEIEDIELLRYFDLNKKIKMVKVSGNSIAVDYPKDVRRVEKILEQNNR